MALDCVITHVTRPLSKCMRLKPATASVWALNTRSCNCFFRSLFCRIVAGTLLQMASRERLSALFCFLIIIWHAPASVDGHCIHSLQKPAENFSRLISTDSRGQLRHRSEHAGSQFNLSCLNIGQRAQNRRQKRISKLFVQLHCLFVQRIHRLSRSARRVQG